MRRFGSFIIAIALLAGGLTAAFGDTYYPLAFYPNYSITGTCNDAPDGTSANGRGVYFYRTIPEYSLGYYAVDTIGTTGLSRHANRFMANAFSLGIFNLTLGGIYFCGIPNDNPANPAEGYGADPVSVTLSGRGLDEISTALQLTKGGGAMLPPPVAPTIPHEPGPAIKVWFGNRLYQPAIYGRTEDGKQLFVVPQTGKIKIEVNIIDPFALDEPISYGLSVQSPQGETKTFNFSALSGSAVTAAGVKPLVIQSNYPEELKADQEENMYTFNFFAASSGTYGLATSVATSAVVAVLGGPLRLIGVPLTFPSPVHLKTDKEADFQYTLSKDGNIEIYVFDISARVVKKFFCAAGTEGGTAGVNKVKWNLMTDQGGIVASGIYVISFIDKDSGKLLGKAKFTALP